MIRHAEQHSHKVLVLGLLQTQHYTMESPQLKLQGSYYSFLTRTSSFRRLAKWAFAQCDADGTGGVNKTELYAGILLVHVQLAKYAGAAACYPPTREVIDSLFEASDQDKSGKIEEAEFTRILMICCAQIFGRIVVYYSIIILLVPYVAEHLVKGIFSMDDFMGWKSKDGQRMNPAIEWLQNIVGWGTIVERIVSLTLFFLFIPTFFNWIDGSSHRAAKTHVGLAQEQKTR